MRIIKPSFEILPRDEQRGNIASIELAARTCYKTEDRITEGSADDMVQRLINSKHEAMLEHGDYIFELDETAADVVAILRHRFEEATGHTTRLIQTHTEGPNGKERWIISGNVRAWRELLARSYTARRYFAGSIDPVFLQGIIPEDERKHKPEQKPLHYGDLLPGLEQKAHLRQTVRFIIDRGVSHEFVRNRGNVGFGFAQESTRYCDYSKDRHGSEITVIEPCYFTPDTDPYAFWVMACATAENAYFTMRARCVKAEEARAVLPTSVKTELVMTGTLGDWQHFFDLRALCKTGKPHPQAYEVAKPLCIEMANRFPDAIKID